MRNKRETDISKYKDKSTELSATEHEQSNAKIFFKGVGKSLLTVFSVFCVAALIAGISLAIYIITLASEPTGIDLRAKSLNQTSRIYVQNEESGEFEEYQKLYSLENRTWVDNQDIPEAMKEAIVAIEDKRYYDHHGVDWSRTLSAVVNLATGADTYGGSTITQQLIKNITDDNEVSLTRKLREICRALKLENEYTKDEILEAYLNVVNFGNNCQGVEAASQLYFGKSIKDCSIAECAAIAGITQNPSKWNPLVYPDNNKIRRETIIQEMYDQEKITEAEYNEAMKESEAMTFVGFVYSDDDDDDDDGYVQNWYIDELFRDAQEDLAMYYNISEDAASEKLYTEGLKIYCAMDLETQEMMEDAARNIDKTYDPELQIAMTMMGFDGRVIASVGSSNEKTGALQFDRATQSSLQPGSSIKPVVVYPYAIDNNLLYFSSTIEDKPIEKYKVVDGEYVAGPNNWYSGYRGTMLLPDAIEISSNGTAVQAMELIGGPSVAYEQVVTKMGFTHLSEDDAMNTGGLSIGGLNGGVTVREMAAAYSYMGNGGLYYEPYTYYYITDSEDNIIIDNRDNVPKQAYSQYTAAIMNRLLHYNITNCVNTNAAYARVDGWDIIGKTGTTDEDKDSWFCGLSPYASLAVWTGYDNPQTISNTNVATTTFSKVMGAYLEDKEQKQYVFPADLVEAQYNPYTGLIVSTENISGKYVGYYAPDNMPAMGSWSNDYDYDSDGEDSTDYTGEETTGGENVGEDSTDETTPMDSAPDSSEGTETPPEDTTPPEGSENGDEGGADETVPEA